MWKSENFRNINDIYWDTCSHFNMTYLLEKEPSLCLYVHQLTFVNPEGNHLIRKNLHCSFCMDTISLHLECPYNNTINNTFCY